MWTLAPGLLIVGIMSQQALTPNQSSTNPAASSELASAFTTIARDLQAAAEMMPPERYGFRPVDGVRSFGQIVAHVAGGQVLYCSQAAGRRPTPELLTKLNEVRPFSDVATESASRRFQKPELVALLVESIAFCQQVYTGAIAERPEAIRALIGNVAHDNEHYGNLVTYLRLNAFIPPSTERRTGGK